MKLSKKVSAALIVAGAVCLLAGIFAYALVQDIPKRIWAMFVLLGIPFGAAFLLTGVLCFPLAKIIETHCTKKTVFLSLLSSAALGIGGICNWFWNMWRANANDGMYEIYKPYLLRGPYIWGTWIGLAVFIVCAVLCVRERRHVKRTSEAAFLLDMGLCVLYLVPFALAYVFVRFHLI